MVLDVKKYKIGNVELGKNEQRLLLLLSDNKYHTLCEIMNYLKLYSNCSVWRIMKRINNKMKEQTIKNYFGKGYKISLQIEITY